ncbi:MAG: hypothetical protein AMXMBFR84_31530 [Candidatus Hydrogenedentota bacterium]
MNIVIPFGSHETLHGVLTHGTCIGTLDIADVPGIADLSSRMDEVFACPIGQPDPVFNRFGPGDTVAITVSDQFRTTGVNQILPAVLGKLKETGVDDGDICFVFATGTHRPPTEQEQRTILGQSVYEAFRGRICNHNPHDDSQLVHMGVTSRGTDVWLNRQVVTRSRVIVTGACVLHYFGGYGGGRKGIVPGLAGVGTIAHNHAMNLDPHDDAVNPAVGIGKMSGNPVAEDMLEAAKLLPITCLINTVLNRQGQIAGLFAGDLELAHAQAAHFARSLYAISIPRKADLVIASSGGTRNFVQSHKALYNAYQAMKPGGRIVLATQCPEGLGGEQFVKWLRLGSRSRVIAGLRQRSEINGQTALSTLEKAPSTYFVTNLSEQDTALMGGPKASSLQEAIDRACADLGAKDITYYVMPSAAYTVPFVDEN